MKESKQVFNIEVPIPSDMVLISRSEYLEFNSKGRSWSMVDD